MERKQNNEDIVLVTGFFNCKRENHEKQKRSDEQYLQYFEFWAGMKNNLVIFGNKEITSKAFDIRKKKGLENRTTVVVVDDVVSCDKKVYDAMKSVEARGEYKKWRARECDISNEALYDYVTFMKFWMMKYVADTYYYSDDVMLAWIDFGFNHGGVCYYDTNDFNFEWRYAFDKEKVHLFARKRPEDEVGFLKLMCMTDGVMAGTILCSCKKTGVLYDKIKDCILAMSALDLMDDEQMVLTMAYKRWPEFFEIHKSDWFMAIKENGGAHMKIQKKTSKKTLLDFYKSHGVFGIFKYLYVRIFHNMSVEKYQHWKRLKKLIKEYN